MTNNKKKTAKEKRVLIGALCIASVMIAGSTFAWFSSKDEVTNRLSASAAYDVSIAEDFQPPEDWIPGQTINKDVSAVNTGNVDAFVRMWLGGQMRLLNETAPTVSATSGTPTASLASVTDQDKVKLGLTYSNATTYYKTLSTTQRKNPDLNNTSNDEENNQPATFSEVQSVQAGGVLVYAPTGAGYHWTLEQATTMSVDGTTVTDLAKGTIVGTNASTYTAGTGETFEKITSSANNNYYGAIDASTFKPETTGLYIFRRNIGETADGTANTYEYSGYYYDSAKDVYFALHNGTGANGNSDYVLPSGAVTENNSAVPSADQVLPVTPASVYLYTAAEQVIETGTADTNLKWTYTAPVTTTGSEAPGYFTVTYEGADTSKTDDDISIVITLANIGTASEEWTAIGSGATTTFYYNNDVEAGDTTRKLVDSVKLADATTQKAYLAFDFDLDVFLESVQVTMDDAGNEQLTPVQAWAATAGKNTGANATGTTGAPEINTITWAATT